MQTISKSKIFGIVIAVFAVLVMVFSPMLFEDADKSKNYVCQMPMTGVYDVWTNGGLQWQCLGSVQEYHKTSQIEFTDLEKNDEGYVAIGENPAAATTFNDKGRGFIVGSFRVVLPSDAQNRKKIQQEVDKTSFAFNTGPSVFLIGLKTSSTAQLPGPTVPGSDS